MSLHRRTHAIVIGASMAGLGTARALCNHFERVTIVERDAPQTPARTRKGVPQGQHAHGLLPSGYRVLQRYFPGMMDEIVAAGAPRGDLTADFLWYQYGCWKLRKSTGLDGVVVSRPFLEHAVSERVRALPKITVLSEHDAEAPRFDPVFARVTGLSVRDRNTGAQRMLDADLVVDASGRGSHAPAWLQAWGFAAPRESSVRIDVGYATAVFDRKPEDLDGAMGGILAGTAPESTRFAAVLGAEGERWVITLVGALRDYPPTEIEGWKQFARTLPTSAVFDMVKDREPLAPIASYRFPANRQLHYHALSRFPAGFLVIGDAICSFNPIYGQGMSVALSEASALDECLARGDGRLAQRFFKRVRALVSSPWAIATGEDYRYPAVQGERPAGFALLNRYMERVHRAASRDPVVLKAFFQVASLLAAPPSLLSPAIAWRVLLRGGPLPSEAPVLAPASAE